jgi:nucleotide-binding universal stress UspA family protein
MRPSLRLARMGAKEHRMKALLAIDGSPESDLAVKTAATLHWPYGSRVDIITVHPTSAEVFGTSWPTLAYAPPTDLWEQLVQERRAFIQAAAAALRQDDVEVATHVIEGRPASVIVDEAEARNVDLIILGARGLGAVERVFLGSVSAEVVDRAHCPVLVARRSTAASLVIATDDSCDARLAVDFVATSGLFAGATTTVVEAVDVPATWWLGFSPTDAMLATRVYDDVVTDGRHRGEAFVANAAARLRIAGFEPSTKVREGAAVPVILDEATRQAADVIVLGTRGHGLLQRLVMGSTARRVLHQAAASVLIVRRGPPTAPSTTDRSSVHDAREAYALGR